MSDNLLEKEFKSIDIRKDSKEMIYIICANYIDQLNEYIIKLEKENKV